MLCQQCHQQEATIHLTVVPWPSSKPAQRDFCLTCYPDAEAAHDKAYNSQPPAPLAVGLEFMTAAEFLETCDKPALYGVDNPTPIYTLGRASRPRDTGQRLAFDLLPFVWRSLERGEDPQWDQVTLVATLWSPEDQAQFGEHEYTTWLEKIIRRCVELRRQLPTPPGEHGPFSLTLSMALNALGLVSRPRFTALVENLKKQGADPALDPRWKVIATAEKRFSRAKRRKP